MWVHKTQVLPWKQYVRPMWRCLKLYLGMLLNSVPTKINSALWTNPDFFVKISWWAKKHYAKLENQWFNRNLGDRQRQQRFFGPLEAKTIHDVQKFHQHMKLNDEVCTVHGYISSHEGTIRIHDPAY